MSIKKLLNLILHGLNYYPLLFNQLAIIRDTVQRRLSMTATTAKEGTDILNDTSVVAGWRLGVTGCRLGRFLAQRVVGIAPVTESLCES